MAGWPVEGLGERYAHELTEASNGKDQRWLPDEVVWPSEASLTCGEAHLKLAFKMPL